MVARAFILIDALPRREKDAFDALDKYPGIVAKRLFTTRVGQGDMIALVEAGDTAELEVLITSRYRSLPFVHNIIRVQPHHTLLGPVQKLMQEMHDEAERAKGKGKAPSR